MKVALVHDDLVQWGGAERVLEAICEIYPDAPIFTSVFDRDNESLERLFGSKEIRTSFLQKIPGWKSLYKVLLPFYPIAFEQFNFDGYDLVISHTSRFAKAIITKPDTTHICYCVTPPRFLWHFSGESNFGFMELLMTKLRVFDHISANRVDQFLANSNNTAKRIKKIYRMDAKVIYPFVDLDRFKDVETFDGGYFVVIARLNKYKRVDLAIDACMELGLALKVIGTGPELESLRRLPRSFAPRNDIEFLGNVEDEVVVQVLAGCRALIVPGIEDFGITPLEAQALGKPVIAYQEGGVLETVIPAKTGIFFKEQNIKSLSEALALFRLKNFNPEDCRKNASRFSKVHFINNFKQTVASLV